MSVYELDILNSLKKDDNNKSFKELNPPEKIINELINKRYIVYSSNTDSEIPVMYLLTMEGRFRIKDLQAKYGIPPKIF